MNILRCSKITKSLHDTTPHLVNGAWNQARDVCFSIEDFGKRGAEARRRLDGWEGVLADVCFSVETKNTPGLVVGDPSLNSAYRLVELPPAKDVTQSLNMHSVSEIYQTFKSKVLPSDG